jgi:allophanate hydrolase
VLPACRSLDCVSIFALTVDDAFTMLSALTIPDMSDPYSRVMPLGKPGTVPPSMVIAVPDSNGRLFFGDADSEQSFGTAIALLRNMGAKIEEIDIFPLLETARLLYEGPWVAERYAAVGAFIEKNPDKVHPVTRQIIMGGAKSSAAEAFRAFYRLTALRRTAFEMFSRFDALMVPTVPAAYTKAQIEADPIALNSNLGTYTNFVNLLDLCGLAVPISFASNGTPYGVTFLTRSGRDAMLAGLGRVVHAQTELPLGALGIRQPLLTPLKPMTRADEITIAVVGAHLSGMPLNGELRALNARFVEEADTAPDYALYALAGTTPPKPGLLRVADGKGAPIALEVWALSAQNFGRFVAAIPAPLAIGMIRLADGRQVQGFLVEPEAVKGARNISDFGGWRAFMERQKTPA